MSKIGKTPIELKDGVSVSLEGRTVTVKGPKGALSYMLPHGVDLKQENQKVLFERRSEEAASNALYGVARATVNNMVMGVSLGFQRQLELSGVGYRASVSGTDLLLSVGFSHPVRIKALPGISFSVAENTITVLGLDKSLVGDVAAKIREVRPPEPYKGKGISYKGERIRRKAGKAAKAVGGKQA